jgi:hypothetical protein
MQLSNVFFSDSRRKCVQVLMEYDSATPVVAADGAVVGHNAVVPPASRRLHEASTVSGV